MTDAPAIELVAFDLDDTLAPSKSPLPAEMADALMRLLACRPVCVISGGRFEQFDTQVIRRLPADPSLRHLHLMPTNGTRYYRYTDGYWVEQYSFTLTDDQRRRSQAALEEEARSLGLWEPRAWGHRVEDRGSQVTFSALGQQAPVQQKRAWDPDGSRREELRRRVQERLPDLDVHSGGSTSVDITLKGIDKAFGIGRLAEILAIDPADILFVGDRLQPGGNDYPVLALGVQSRAVADWTETLDVVTELQRRLDRPPGRPAART